MRAPLPGPQKAEPAQQVHPIGTNSRVRTTSCLQVTKVRGHRLNRSARRIDQRHRLPRVTGRLQGTFRRHNYFGHIPHNLVVYRHSQTIRPLALNSVDLPKRVSLFSQREDGAFAVAVGVGELVGRRPQEEAVRSAEGVVLVADHAAAPRRAPASTPDTRPQPAPVRPGPPWSRPCRRLPW